MARFVPLQWGTLLGVTGTSGTLRYVLFLTIQDF
jgi:hypothetical protein